MKRRRFFVSRHLIAGQTAVLPREQAHHLRDVLRMGVGEAVELFDGEGNAYIGIVEESGREVCIGRIELQGATACSSLRVILAAGLIKQDRFEWMLQKATELGADEFVPLSTRRSNLRIPHESMEARLRRWHRIVAEAARQCGRSDIPTIRPPADFGAFLSAESCVPCAKFLFLEGAATMLPHLLSRAGRTIACIGPEGGWDPDEAEAARDAGFLWYSLGPRILRSETAAIAAVALIQHCHSDYAPGPASAPGTG